LNILSTGVIWMSNSKKVAVVTGAA